MGAIRGPKGKRERALGENLLLKGERSLGPKAAVVRRPQRPGQHGKRHAKALSDFGRQIREKQKFKLSYGLDERNLKQVVLHATRMPGSTAGHILELLERRLDNVVYRMGFAPSRSAARKLVIDGHILVNTHKVRSPGFVVKLKDAVSIRPESATKGAFTSVKETLKTYEVPSWLRVDGNALRGEIVALPTDPSSPFEINLLVESFSK
jgi:small subunit ribosomal protein S4